ALRQAVHAVVMDDIQHVEVPAARVHEVAATDPEAVSVAAQAEDLELRIRELHPGRIGEGAPVQRVDSIGLHVVNRLRRASDPRDDRHPMRLHPQFREGHLNRPEDTEVAACRAPVVEPQDTMPVPASFGPKYLSFTSWGISCAARSSFANRFSIIALRRPGSSVMWPISSCSSPVFQKIVPSWPGNARADTGPLPRSNRL